MSKIEAPLERKSAVATGSRLPALLAGNGRIGSLREAALSRRNNLLLILTTLGVFAYTFRPITANDTFFGLKIGQFIVTSGRLPFTEPFSWSALGRPIIPYEWLAQVLIYLVFKVGGFTAIQVYTSAMATLTFLLTFVLCRSSLKRDFVSSLLLSLLLINLMAEFFVSRPHLIAFVSFILLLHLILNYLNHLKSPQSPKLLWFILPTTYVWANSHASFIFAPYLLFSFALIRRSRRLFSFGLLTLVVTLLPPLWHKTYLLLWHFLNHLNVITKFIVEWGNLTFDPVASSIYLTLAVVTAITFLLSPKRWLALPLMLIVIASFQAIRQIAFGSIAAITTLALLLPRFSLAKSRLFTLITSLTLITSIFALFIYKRPSTPNLPNFEADMAFLRTHQLHGRMFNEFALGSYLLYYLYPQYQVFFDGRADVYLCCEIPQFLKVIAAKHASPQEFRQAVDDFIHHYQFSYLVIPYPSYNPLELSATTRMADILLDDPNWRLIYASDNLQIILKNDGRNQDVWDNLSLTAITPYRLQEFRPDQATQAEADYRRLISLQDSGIARTGLGFALLAQQKYPEAKINFETAIKLNPYLGKPHLGLAKIAAPNDPTSAISHLNQAVKLSPYLGEAYLLLAQTYRDQNNLDQAISTINAGLDQNIDLLSRQKLVQFLNQFR